MKVLSRILWWILLCSTLSVVLFFGLVLMGTYLPNDIQDIVPPMFFLTGGSSCAVLYHVIKDRQGRSPHIVLTMVLFVIGCALAWIPFVSWAFLEPLAYAYVLGLIVTLVVGRHFAFRKIKESNNG